MYYQLGGTFNGYVVNFIQSITYDVIGWAKTPIAGMKVHYANHCTTTISHLYSRLYFCNILSNVAYCICQGKCLGKMS